jgi:hypothetical protein
MKSAACTTCSPGTVPAKRVLAMAESALALPGLPDAAE